MLDLVRPKIHYTELPDPRPDEPPDLEYETYRREVGRLLAEGHEGKFVLIKDDQIIGIFETKDEAREEALRRYLLQKHMVHCIRTWEPTILLPWHRLPCPS